MLAAEMGPGLPQHLAQAISKVEPRLDLYRYGLAVQGKIDLHQIRRL
jgi:hypothetical protein